MPHQAHEVVRKIERCIHCGKRIFLTRAGKYGLAVWMHYGYAIRECDGLVAKYATPKEQSDGHR